MGDGGIVQPLAFALQEVELHRTTAHQVDAPLTVVNMMDEHEVVNGRDQPTGTLHAVSLRICQLVFERKKMLYPGIPQEICQVELFII